MGQGASYSTRRHLLRGSLALATLGLLAGCTIQPPWAQPPRVSRIGVLSLGPSTGPGEPSPYVDALRAGLLEHGYAEGQNVTLDFRTADTRQQFSERTAELARLDADVLVLIWGPPHAVKNAAKTAAKTIPVVFTTVADPTQGTPPLVAAFARPGGNATGLSTLSDGLAAKRLQLLKEVAPSVTNVALLFNAEVPDKGTAIHEMVGAGAKLGLRLQAQPVRSPADIEGVFQAVTGGGIHALFTFGDHLTLQERGRIADFAVDARLPSMYEYREFAEAGGLLAYGPNIADQCHRAAAYVDKILKGTNPADLPVEQPTRFDFVINLKTAQALGLDIPSSVLQQATEIIH
jgi:putative ABC transport system substrate-binding protein